MLGSSATTFSMVPASIGHLNMLDIEGATARGRGRRSAFVDRHAVSQLRRHQTRWRRLRHAFWCGSLSMPACARRSIRGLIRSTGICTAARSAISASSLTAARENHSAAAGRRHGSALWPLLFAWRHRDQRTIQLTIVHAYFSGALCRSRRDRAQRRIVEMPRASRAFSALWTGTGEAP